MNERGQTIEIDVPEGMEISSIERIEKAPTDGLHPKKWNDDEEGYKIKFSRKEDPEFVEVREYLHKVRGGYVLHAIMQRNTGITQEQFESSPGFIRWVDNTWRKIYL